MIISVLSITVCIDETEEGTVYWFMDERFAEAYQKANIVLKELDYQRGRMIPTSEIISTVERISEVDVMFREFNFSLLDEKSGKDEFAHCGAAMYVSSNENKRTAKILLNTKETPEMQRFSLVHEMGHLMLDNMQAVDIGDSYLFSTHIDMDITSISDEDLEDDDFLVEEQKANIFALLVLIPYDSLLTAMRKYDSLDDIAKIFGVEKNAVISRIMLGLEQGA